MELPESAVVCAARHFAAAHESACTGTPVNFGQPCVQCSEWAACRGRWMETAAPIFDAAGVHPIVFRRPDEIRG